MQIRQKDGYYKGQTREFPSEVGLALIRAGRGENPFAETNPVAPKPITSAAAAAPVAQVSSASSKKGGRR